MVIEQNKIMDNTVILMSNLPVPAQSKEVWDRYMKQKRTKRQVLQQMLIHCEKTGFNPATAPLDWGDK